MTFLECLKMELHVFSKIRVRVSVKLIRFFDIYSFYTQERRDVDEGVNYLFFDKKQGPFWEPNSFAEIDFEKDIRSRFYKDCLTNKTYQGIWSVNENLGSEHEPCNVYALPSQKEIETVFKRLNENVGAAVDWFLEKNENKYGVKQKVEAVSVFIKKRALYVIYLVKNRQVLKHFCLGKTVQFTLKSKCIMNVQLFVKAKSNKSNKMAAIYK